MYYSDGGHGSGGTSPNAMKRLVVNADDFGMADSINEGILEAHQHGIVTSTTLLANGSAFDAAVTMAKSAPKLGVGVHLNLTQGVPVADATRVPTLVTRGEFARSPAALLRSLVSGRVRLDEVEHELSAQIEKVRAAGIAITHLDGHKHVHMLPQIFPVVLRVAKRYGIPAVRRATERSGGMWRLLGRKKSVGVVKQSVQSRALNLMTRNSRSLLRQAGLHFPMHFYGTTQTGFLDQQELAALLRRIPEGTSELMCHPGSADRHMDPKLTRLRAERQRELEALTRPETLELVARLGIELIDYRGLVQS
jgi:hopanoid biosynthesis associated protein HpnK